MRRLRELITHITVGEYSFDIKITKAILHDSLEKCDGIWEFMQQNQELKEEDLGKMPVGEIMKKAEETDRFYECLDEFIADILPKMIAAAEESTGKQFNGTIDEFLDYCDENDVLDDVEMKLFEFAMLGFTGGKGNTESKPKLKVVMG